MGNFDFVEATLPSMAGDCRRAESYMASDPSAACFYSRRAVEVLVGHLYRVLNLPTPYKDDLAARINQGAFTAEAGQSITQKLNLIRKVGNTAVHENRSMPPRVAQDVLRELHHVMVWAAFRYSTDPDAVPTRAQFDPALAAKAAPLSRDDVAKLAAKFAAQDAAHAKALAEKDDVAQAQAAEIAELRAQIQAAQATKKTTVDEHDYTEAETRDLFIDVLLAEAGWPLANPHDREYEVTGMPNESGKGLVDYVLWGEDGLPLAVVEAKRTTKSAHEGRHQADLYADCLEARFGRRPVVFFTNGYEHWLWDDVGGYPPRKIQGFFTRDELELMIRRRTTRGPLVGAPIDGAIVERPYQRKAIAAVGQALDEKQRDALLVMATGSGKTRTVIALVDQLLKANWVRRVLFLADRLALVNQAVNAFKTHLPAATTVNLVTEKVTDGRVFVATYPTMLNVINATDGGLRRFGPGYFDLVVIDEAHRSVYQKYGAIFEWFDALLVGLTATPKDEVDHNTYHLFHLEDGVPTDAYDLQQAVDDGYLVPPRGVAIGTKFLRHGITYAGLSEAEKEQWDALDWGEDDPPDEIGAEEINKFLFNEDTVDKVLAEVMERGYKVAGGDRLGKTIVFAKNQAHAEFIQQRFDLQWPQYAGEFAAVITHGTPYAQHLIDSFSNPVKGPHLAISVDMLDTGIDVPEVVNLVFFKAVRSKSKFWQMIGRGTRLRPDLFGPGQDKTDFLVFDFCGNLEYFNQNLPGVEGSVQKSLTQRLVEHRVGLVRALDATKADGALRESTATTLHEFVVGMSLDNVLVRPHRAWVEKFAQRDAWSALSDDDARAVVEQLAGLPSSATKDEEDAKRFDLLVLRRQLAQLEGDAVAVERLRESIQGICSALLGKTTIPSVAQQQELLEDVAGDQWWVDVTLPMLEQVRVKVRGLVRLVDKIRRDPVYSDFTDELGQSVEVSLPGTTPGTNPERFRAKATAYLRAHEDHAALQRLRRNLQLTPLDLEQLEAMLVASGAGEQTDIDTAVEQAHGLGRFIRSLVGLDRSAAVEAFATYLDDTRFTLDQIRFVNMIVDELTASGLMEPGRLFETPYIDQGADGIDSFFPENDVEVIVDILHDITKHAQPVDAA
ncbi:DEAD/DEAH box helicase family protein [Actinomycetospora chiangmaiensis]|uniref:DEAD/DEAH box helicase family protein n=1 Tax=Actinomycetospora chiangmaiensis TaxID=402650 RepID=UPI000362DEE4|nr:DEAD/DEAH box helicase family protein [Actinomycetospora chiangmaiensis]